MKPSLPSKTEYAPLKVASSGQRGNETLVRKDKQAKESSECLEREDEGGGYRSVEELIS